MISDTNGKRILLIINPIAGRIRLKPSLPDIAGMFRKNGYTVDMFLTASKGHATDIVMEQGKGHDIVVCCGGDGTLNEVVSGIMKSKSRLLLGYIPAGTTNDYASSLKLPYRIDKAVNTILKGRIRKLDVGLFKNKRYFNYIASFGAFTESSYSTPQSAKNTIGHLAYVLEGVKDIPNIRPYHVKAEAGGVVYEDDYIFGAVSNSTSIAGMVKLDINKVDLNDGLFEVILIKNPKTAIDLSRILRAATKRDFDDRMIEFIKASEVTFTLSQQIPWTIDGEYEAGGSKIHIRNIPNAISILA